MIRRLLASAALFAALTACPGPIDPLAPPSSTAAGLAFNAALIAEGKARERCSSSSAERTGLRAARVAFDLRYSGMLDADQRERLDTARRETDACIVNP